MTWNQASLKWRTYRAPKSRMMHSPVGDASKRFDVIDGSPKCGHHECPWHGPCVGLRQSASAVPAAFTGDLDWYQAKAAMVAGHVVSTAATDSVGRWRHCEGAFRCRMQSDHGRFVWPVSNMFNRPEPREFHKDNRYRVVDGEP